MADRVPELEGDADLARAAALFAEPARARVLLALADGRALPASLLADEAGVSAQATSAHLKRLHEAGLVTVEPSGRHRYYRLAGADVAAVLEALARIAPAQTVRSLRQGTRANALRSARTCYDHLAGQLGVAITAALLQRQALAAVDGHANNQRRAGDPLSAPLDPHPYQLGPAATDIFAALGVDLPALQTATSRRPLLRFCVDWTEQQHHLAGRLGAAVTDALLHRGWLVRQPRQRAVRLTRQGATSLSKQLGLNIDPSTLP